MAVVLFHARVPGFDGGFAGVDVFFVISGFLITGNLLREHERDGRVRLSRFFVRRFVRLAPAAAATVLATVAAGWILLPPLDRVALRPEALAALFGAENLWLAWTGSDYLAQHDESPFQQFWSLGVEEQFYVVWAIALAVVLAVRPLRCLLLPTVALICGLSFAVMVWTVSTSVPWAFYSPVTRLWELGFGALLAVTLGSRTGAVRHWTAGVVRTTALPTGSALLAVAILVFRADTPWPGVLTLLPVAGTALVLVTTTGAEAVRRVLACRTLTWIGDRSYSIYLVHWPIMLLWARVAERPLGPVETTVALIATTVLAHASYTLLERGVGTWTRPRRGNTPVRRKLVLGAAVTAVAALVVPATAVPPLHGTEQAPVASTTAVLDGPWAPQAVPANLTPSIVSADESLPRIYSEGCHADLGATTARGCRFGPGPTTVALFGDSHAAQWSSPLRALTQQEGAALVTMTKSSCPSLDLAVASTELGRPYLECDSWRQDVRHRLEQLRPDVVVLSNAANSYRQDADAETWGSALERSIRSIRASTGARVVVLGDTPLWQQSPNRCLSASIEDVAACSAPQEDVMDAARSAAQVAAARSAGADYVDPVPWVCDDRCAPVLWNVLVYRDANHLTDTMARALTPRLRQVLALDAIGAQRVSP